jgi:transposase
MEEITEEPGALTERVAALDIGKASLTACIRVPHEAKPGARRQEVRVRTYTTTTPALLELRDWLVCQGVTLVVMEAASAYWKPPFYLLEDDLECQVVNARDVKNVPGRPKTDKLDAVWLCKLAERGMLRPSFIPDRAQRQLRDLTSRESSGRWRGVVPRPPRAWRRLGRRARWRARAAGARRCRGSCRARRRRSP